MAQKKNHVVIIWVIHEIEGGSLVRGFTQEEDANNFFRHQCIAGELEERYYKVSPLPLEDMSKSFN
jgi:hypothetical protein